MTDVVPIASQRRGFLKPNPLTNYENTLVRDFHPTWPSLLSGGNFIALPSAYEELNLLSLGTPLS